MMIRKRDVLVYGELLIGDSGGSGELLRLYGLMHQLTAVSHADVVAFARANRLHGRGIGWVDAHLPASALAANALLWTADERLAELAGELGVGAPAGRTGRGNAPD
ncbi:MAG: VapC toxin family PIN domain ribonuclease [Bryobacterales bacterium]|nr:VapC toxin family PIN domain ribonuclease [Bryobacterales bacterium]